MEITRISLALPFKLGQVNCYLLRTGSGCVLIDTGPPRRRDALDRTLARAGCQPGQLRLVVLTHGDFDHTGNAAHLRERFGTPIAMHPADAGMLERGDMFYNRRTRNALVGRLAAMLSGFGKAERCVPDLLVDDGDSLAEYGLEARVLHLPGHSSGSIGILAAGGAPSAGSGQGLFCGDLLENRRRPGLSSIMDDPAAARASVERLAGLEVGMVYPGHGEPFPMEALAGLEG